MQFSVATEGEPGPPDRSRSRGSIGQVLVKRTVENYETIWVTPVAAGVTEYALLQSAQANLLEHHRLVEG